MLNSHGTKRTYRKITSLILFGDAVVAVAVAVAVVLRYNSLIMLIRTAVFVDENTA